ncbi:hypothetical protein CN558_23890, partial [Bacillus wiedmannii]
TVIYMLKKNKEYMNYSLIWNLIRKILFTLIVSILSIILVKKIIENSWLLKSESIFILICSALMYLIFYMIGFVMFEYKETMMLLKNFREKVKK